MKMKTKKLSPGQEFANRIMGDANPALHSKPQHTPTPWKVWPEGGDSVRTPITEVSIARCSHHANAAFIVEAVNAHQLMLTALQDIYATLKDVKGSDTKIKFDIACASAFLIARSALAKAEQVNTLSDNEEGK